MLLKGNLAESEPCDAGSLLHFLSRVVTALRQQRQHSLLRHVRNGNRSALRTVKRLTRTRRNAWTHVKTISRNVCRQAAGKAKFPHSDAALRNNNPNSRKNC